MNYSNIIGYIMDLIARVRGFFYKIIIGEIFINEYKKDTRSKIARVIDLFIPLFAINLFLFVILFSHFNSIVLSILLCTLISIIFIKGIKLIKALIIHYLQEIYNLKDKIKNTYKVINNLNPKELENYSYELLEKIDLSKYPKLFPLNDLRNNIKLKVIFNTDNDDELTIANKFKNELLSSNIKHGILILNYPANNELIKLVKSYSMNSNLNIFIIDLYSLINLAITHETNLQLDKITTVDEGQFKYNLSTYNQQLLFYKKKVYNHLAVALLLGIIGEILDSMGNIYITLSFINVIVALISLFKYVNSINVLIPGSIDTKIISNFQR